MPNCFTCKTISENRRLHSRIIALENGDEIKGLNETIRNLEAQLNGIKAGIKAETVQPMQPKNTTGLLAKIDRLQEEIVSKNRRIEELENTLREDRNQAKKERQESKAKIDELEKDLSTAQWRRDKDLRDMKEEHRKECVSMEKKHQQELELQRSEYEAQLQAKDKEIQNLRNLLNPDKELIPREQERLSKKAVQIDSTTSSMPPIQDPKHPTIVSNNRRKSEKPVGGQIGHPHHPRKFLEPTKIVEIKPPQEVLDHPDEYYPIGTITKQRICVRSVIYVVQYEALKYRHRSTKRVIHGEFPADMGSLEVNYDPSVEAALSWLHSVGNMPYNKITELLREQTGGLVVPSEGTMVNLEKRFAKATPEKREEIARNMLKDSIMNIDGTYVRVNGKLQNVLIMKTESGVFYQATGCKGQKAVDQTFAGQFTGTTVCDGEVTFHKLGKNYQQCLFHTSRYLKGGIANEPWLTFPSLMHSFLWDIIGKRDIQKGLGLPRMQEDELKKVKEKYRELIRLGEEEYEKYPPRDSYRKCYTTFLDMAKNEEHYLLFLTDYRLPYHNNEAEKSGRELKIHSRINGGLRSFEALGNHSKTMTVLETEHKHGNSRMEVLRQGFERAKANNGQPKKLNTQGGTESL